ncbi:hemagglutinin/amebocyte aggregation factor-like [Chanos chanos]|uniref:Hemagglutinin/amebocyte aggregation factor-like n=1 Tax=Chanos chanos TaxID=29144 RepID=A0A6J2W9I1_CHACN|nr:hemagglutinin/amebocyte aggregation factor-like [Chanos chanos]
MREVQIFLLLTSVLVHGRDPRWQNSYDEPLHFACPVRQSISYISSQHDNHREDRLWDFGCKDTFSSEPTCFWSEYANDFDQEFTFQCPKNYVLTGMNSYHDNHHEDRRWRFHCCLVHNQCNAVCQWTTYINYFDEPFSWSVPTMNYLVGTGSYHSNSKEDRRWRYMYCTRQSC